MPRPTCCSRVALLVLAALLPCAAQAWGQPCPPTPTPAGSLVIKAPGSRIINLAIDVTTLYWSDSDGRLWRSSKHGGVATELVPRGDRAFAVLVHGDTIYYSAKNAIRRMPVAGGSSSEVVKVISDPVEMITDGRSLFYTTSGKDSPVRQVDLASGKAIRTFPSKGLAAIALHGTELYVASYSGTVTRWPIAGGAPRVLVRDRTLVGIAVDDDAIYYTTETDGLVKRLPRRGGRPRVLARDFPSAESLFLVGRHVYWFDRLDGWSSRGHHELWRAPRNGRGRPEKVLTGFCAPDILVFDETHLYVANGDGHGGAILRMPRP